MTASINFEWINVPIRFETMSRAIDIFRGIHPHYRHSNDLFILEKNGFSYILVELLSYIKELEESKKKEREK